MDEKIKYTAAYGTITWFNACKMPPDKDEKLILLWYNGYISPGSWDNTYDQFYNHLLPGPPSHWAYCNAPETK